MQSIKNFFSCLLVVLAATAFSCPAFAAYDFVSIDYPGAAYTLVFGVNNSGHVTGTGFNADDTVLATFSYDSKKGVYTPIAPAPGSLETNVSGINEAGAMVGVVVFLSGGPDSGFVRSKKGAYTVFSHPAPLENTEPRAVTNSGLVSGFAFDDAQENYVGFIYDPARNVFIDFLPSPFTIAQGINNRGEVVGDVSLDAGVACTGCLAGRYGFLRAPSGAVTYFRVNGKGTAARGITDSGLVTGFVLLGGGTKGFVTTLAGLPYESITIPDAALLEFPGAVITIPEAITNAGAIVGIWNAADGIIHGFIATQH